MIVRWSNKLSVPNKKYSCACTWMNSFLCLNSLKAIHEYWIRVFFLFLKLLCSHLHVTFLLRKLRPELVNYYGLDNTCEYVMMEYLKKKSVPHGKSKCLANSAAIWRNLWTIIILLNSTGPRSQFFSWPTWAIISVLGLQQLIQTWRIKY
jgi:hypothetical protein